MLGALLKQLVGSGNIPQAIRQAFEDAKGHLGGVGLEDSELLKMLKAVIVQRRRVVICIDGLDESLAADRTGLLSSLRATVKELPNIRLFLTARPFIRSEVEKYFPSADTISVSPTKEDIEAFLETKLEGDTEPDAMDECLRADIMEIIPKKISEIFLLVSLSIEAILGETTIHRREEKLKQISKGQDIEDLYTATLSRIKAQKPDRSRLGMEAIMWVAHSEQPLRPEELCQVLWVEIGSQDLNNRNVPSMRTILSCGLGLVTVDSSSSTVRLVHFTLQEYILANPTLFPSPHSAIAEVCLTYLNFGCIRDLSPTLSLPLPTTPFLEYASCHWGAHAREKTNTSVISLALKLLDQFDEHISCKLLLLKEYEMFRLFNVEGKPIGFTGIHGAAFFGVVEIMASLFETKRWDPNATDLLGNTALVWAAAKGHDRVVKMLLDRKEVDPNLTNKNGWAPLQRAANHGHEEIVGMLLEQNNINPDLATNRGETPLATAVILGWEHIAVTLLERSDVDPDAADVNGRTPFSWATAFMRERLVEILLERGDVNPDGADNKGRTPLSRAAEEWTVETVQMLLERSDVNPDAPDNQGRTPLSWASVGWTDPDNVEWDTEGDSDPEYHWGEVRNGSCEKVAEMLLEKNDVNPDAADESGRTPLSWAASHGNEVFVKLLLERSDVNPNTTDEKGRTPLVWATIYGHGEIVKMLLERSNVDPDTQDEDGRTPLSFAAEGGYGRIVEMLLGRSDVDSNTLDDYGQTPLAWAAGFGNDAIVKMLLERNDVSPGTVNNSGQTPCSLATMSGHKEIVDMLLGRNCANFDSADETGGTPFLRSAGGLQEGAAEMPFDGKDANPDTADDSGLTLLSGATAIEHAGVEQFLRSRHDLTTNSGLREESFERFATEPPELPEPPLKRIRMF